MTEREIKLLMEQQWETLPCAIPLKPAGWTIWEDQLVNDTAPFELEY